jgi:hypothetical protein
MTVGMSVESYFIACNLFMREVPDQMADDPAALLNFVEQLLGVTLCDAKVCNSLLFECVYRKGRV